MGDIAFPAFSLAKVERKAPQMIAADIAEKINSQPLKRLLQQDLTSTFSLINVLFRLRYYRMLSLKKNTMLTKPLANKKMLLSICPAPQYRKTILYWALCVQLSSEIAYHIFSKKIGYQTVKVNHLGRLGQTVWDVDCCLQKMGRRRSCKAHPIDEL